MSIIGKLPYSNNQTFQAFLKDLPKIISEQFANNKAIKYIKSDEKIVEEKGIPFSVRLIETLAQKPTLLQNQYEEIKETQEVKSKDPFSPPFEDGLYIGELTETHRLLFNKFSIANEHVLVITKENEDQKDPLKI